MRARIKKWGNNLIMRGLQHLARHAKRTPDTAIDTLLVDGEVFVASEETSPMLAELLAGITQNNIHLEISTGAVLGNEAW